MTELAILSQLRPAPGSRHRRKRLGCGSGSGHGQTSTRGQKGQRSRSGDGKLLGFEGGQTPLLRRVPKRGFRNTAFRVEYQVVHLGQIQKIFTNQKEVTVEAMVLHKLVRDRSRPVKVLSDGEIKQPFKIQANAFSKSAAEKIQKAGGSTEVIKA